MCRVCGCYIGGIVVMDVIWRRLPSLWTVVFCTRVAWVCLLCLLLCKEECSSPVSLQLQINVYEGLYQVPLSLSLLGFGMGTILANFHMCGIMLLLHSSFNMLVIHASPREPMYFRCLMFSLS